MMDSNGSSTVSTSELAAFLAKNMPEIHRSNDEVEALMRVMTGQMASGGDDAVEEDDDDPLAGPMSIISACCGHARQKVASRRSASWLDFRRAMEDWLLSDKDRFALVSEKNLDSGRAKIHTAIQAWFNQFQSGEGMWPAEPELGPGPLEAAEIALADFPVDHSKYAQFETLPLPNLSLQRFSRYDKDEYIDHLGEGDFGQLMAAVRDAADAEEAYIPTRTVYYLLRGLVIFRTPMERREIGDGLIGLFSAIETALPRLVIYAGLADHEKLQEKALLCLGLLARGPCIGALPDSHAMHETSLYYKELIKSLGGARAMRVGLDSNNMAVTSAALLAIGACLYKTPEMRSALVEAGIDVAVVNLTRSLVDSTLSTTLSSPSVVFLRRAVWVLSLFCGATTGESAPWERISPALPLSTSLVLAFGKSIFDPVVLHHALAALAHLLPGIAVEHASQELLLALVALVTSEHAAARVSVLSALVHILTDDSLAAILLSLNLVDALTAVLPFADGATRLLAVHLAGVLAGMKGQVQPLIEARSFVALTELVASDPVTRVKALRVLQYGTRGTASQVKYLVEDLGMVSVLCECLKLFHFEDDDVLTQMYEYTLPVLKFGTLSVVLKSIKNILNAGDIEADALSDVNPYVARFSLDELGIFGQLLEEMTAVPTEVLGAWRFQEPGKPSAEARIHGVLLKLRSVFEAMRGKQARHRATYIRTLMDKFFDSGLLSIGVPSAADTPSARVGPSAGRALPIKATLEDPEWPKAPIFFELRSVKYHDLVVAVQKQVEYFGKLVMYYVDEELKARGDGEAAAAAVEAEARERMEASHGVVMVDSQAAFERAVGHFYGLRVQLHVVRDKDDVTPALGLQTSILFDRKNAMDMASNGPMLPGLDVGAFAFSPAAELATVTHFGSDELETLYEQWKAIATGDLLDEEQFAHGLRMLGCTDDETIHRNFVAFDSDRNGSLDFREYVAGLSTLQRGTDEERMRLLFAAYDTDGNGILTRDEMAAAMQASVQARGDQISATTIDQLVRTTFDNLGGAGTQGVDVETFVQAALAGNLSLIFEIHVS
ncbi:EF hand family protein [Thecamonas trahens ATCC 50062]|uniref:EF hand family protein n=1 Tax=Thecamonas trahens ATCC 50062 TaxID=461836 RepID=A0A0L0DJ35_THETB|nr:EF hand family protein [Thecamonas trahens ATCC 50062]KNC52414.1 EF hand family protein [Thecamonas trahens ATCC 50062]|eukprot:XP_013755457.1 EF hand family protein [Thecamonas trahens ATCC 50062]